MTCAYRFALDPTPTQRRALLSHAGAARVAHNWAPALVRATMAQRGAERTYGVDGDRLTPAVSWSLYGLRRAWNAAKPTVAPWWAESSKEAYNSGLDALARALGNWSTSRSGERAGRAVGFPRFTSRHRTAPSVRFTTGAIRVDPDRHHVILPHPCPTHATYVAGCVASGGATAPWPAGSVPTIRRPDAAVSRRTGGAAPDEACPQLMPAWRTCAGTACTS